MEPECSLPCPQNPQSVPILIQVNPVHTLQPYFPSSHLRLDLPRSLFHWMYINVGWII
jgi:hypothetical protein